jgi:hypothetical protein
MRALGTVAAAVAMLMLSQAALAQDAPAKVESVLKQVPAGSLGYLVIPDVKQAGANADKYLADIGVRELMGPQFPGTVEFLKTQAQLGEGFNPNGGLAVVMLDPKPFGFTMDAPDPSKLPLVVFVPATGVQALFSNYEITPEGQFSRVKLRMGEVLATQVGGYVVFGFNADALKAVLAAEKKADGELSKAQAAALAKCDVAYRVNIKLATPMIFDSVNEMLPAMPPGAGPDIKQIMAVYREMLSQFDSGLMTFRFTPKALVVDMLADPVDGSDIAKMLAMIKAPKSVKIDMVPNLSYAMAMAAWYPEPSQVQRDFNDKVMNLMAVGGTAVTPEQLAKMKKTANALQEQITQVQFSAGSAPPGNGQVAVAFAIKCKDSAVLMPLMSDYAELAQELYQAMGVPVKLTYAKNVAKSGEIDLDAITIDPGPQLSAKDRTQMEAVFGKDPLRMLIAPADKTTVVLTFGGSTPFMTQAIATATKPSGNIAAGDDVQDALKVMPTTLQVLGMVNIGNFVDLVANISKAVGEDAPQAKVTVKTPIVFGAGVTEKSYHVVVYVPTSAVKDLVASFASESAPAAAPQPARPPMPLPPGDSF